MHLTQNTHEWYAYRRKKIGASDASIILEVSPWKTPYQLWLEKTGNSTSPTTPQQKRGLEMEESARQSFERMTGMIMFPKVMEHPTLNWMMASLDGIDMDSTAIVEIKCPGQVDHAIAKQGKIPEKYVPQLQHQLAVTGLEMAYYFSFDGNDGVIVEVEKDEQFISKMIDLEQVFWNCLVTLSPPPMNKRDIIERDDQEWVAVSNKWRAIKQQLELLENEEKSLRNTLIQMANNHSTIGGGIRLTRSTRRGSVQYAQIPEIRGIDLEKYRKKPTEIWRLTRDQ